MSTEQAALSMKNLRVEVVYTDIERDLSMKQYRLSPSSLSYGAWQIPE